MAKWWLTCSCHSHSIFMRILDHCSAGDILTFSCERRETTQWSRMAAPGWTRRPALLCSSAWLTSETDHHPPPPPLYDGKMLQETRRSVHQSRHRHSEPVHGRHHRRAPDQPHPGVGAEDQVSPAETADRGQEPVQSPGGRHGLAEVRKYFIEAAKYFHSY